MWRHGWIVGAFFLSGCSTAPFANFLDWVAPGRAPQPIEERIPPGRLGDPGPIRNDPPILDGAPSRPEPGRPIPTDPKVPPLDPIPTSVGRVE